EMRLDMRVQLRTLRRGVGAAAAAAAVLAAFGTGRHLSPVSLLAGGVLAIAAWAIVLSVTREVSRNDLRSALGSLRRRPREQQPEQAADSPPAGIGP
ncbi:MAG: hypothetical protein JWM71_1415, partial [Solirubrobacteraceae bacterium]|nr:hypothetical protein [Solirubrobacteraceae bacterium]